MHTAPSSAEVFIDFEGDSKNPPTFLGVLARLNGEISFTQYILEPVFNSLEESSKSFKLCVMPLEDLLLEIDNRYGVDVPVYAWSSREQVAINELLASSEIADKWKHRIIDAKKIARKWAREKHPNHEFKKTDSHGRHTLDQYLKLVEYEVPAIHGPGNTGSRIRAIRTILERGKPYESWTPVQKRYWSNLLAHNKHDCYGMMTILDRVSDDNNQLH